MIDIWLGILVFILQINICELWRVVWYFVYMFFIILVLICCEKWIVHNDFGFV